MMQTKKAPGGAGTFLRFAWQQLRNRTAVRVGLDGSPAFSQTAPTLRTGTQEAGIDVETLTVSAREVGWHGSGIRLRSGQHFRVFADGAVWISKLFSVGASPATALWLRLGSAGPIHKMHRGGSFD